VGPEVLEEAEARGLQVIDATCPFVRKAQVAAQSLGKAGFRVLVFGDATHPEVRGVLGWAGENATASLEAASLEPLPQRLGIVCQTTESQERFAEFVAQVISHRLAKFAELRIFSTICDATRKHQKAALELAERADLMLVIGGHDSANTRRLAGICAETGVVTHHIESADAIDPSWLRGQRHVGITAGASTPDEVIDGVVSALEEMVGQN
jgi:4-hydroxy-3-methylbut-2-enyl diphosphate reductase